MPPYRPVRRHWRRTGLPRSEIRSRNPRGSSGRALNGFDRRTSDSDSSWGSVQRSDARGEGRNRREKKQTTQPTTPRSTWRSWNLREDHYRSSFDLASEYTLGSWSIKRGLSVLVDRGRLSPARQQGDFDKDKQRCRREHDGRRGRNVEGEAQNHANGAAKCAEQW